MGDLGNVFADDAGIGRFELIDNEVSLFGKHSVIGRSCFLHNAEDDLG